MPAAKAIMVLVIFSVLPVSTTLGSGLASGQPNATLSSTPASNLNAALQWLAGNQSSNGSYGAYEEGLAAAAAYALWLNNPVSQKAAISYTYLATQLNSSSSWFWGTEADVPGAVLYSIASSSNLHLINATSVAANILKLQLPHSGFSGYYDSSTSQPVTSSVDTDMALLGLVHAKQIPSQNLTDSTNYLLSLQNPDGSFNLTKSISYDPLDFLGPDAISITALTILTLRSADFTVNNQSIASGLAYLKNAASTNFNGHLYAAAIADLVFKAYNQASYAVTSTLFILSQQNCDGGFSDTIRLSHPESNALDTGWAATALETLFPGENGTPLVNSQRVNCQPIADFQINPSKPSVGSLVRFNASASHDPDTDQLSYNWTFGDGSGTRGVDPTHTYSRSGNFTITLTVSDSGTNPGPLSDTESLTVTVNPTVVQNSSNLPLGSAELWIIVGVVGLVAIIGVAFYLGRTTAKMSTARNVTD